jgi:hypothetical protein
MSKTFSFLCIQGSIDWMEVQANETRQVLTFASFRWYYLVGMAVENRLSGDSSGTEWKACQYSVNSGMRQLWPDFNVII